MLAALVLAFAQAGTITGISPAVADRGSLVTITGEGFGGPNVNITVGGRPVSVVSATGSKATFRVPALAGPGRTIVRATNPGGHTGTIGLDVNFDGHAALTTNAAAAAGADIGPAGGEVAAGTLRLTVPAGALQQTTHITITPLASLQGSPFDDSLIAGAKFEPDGLHFLVPATLHIALPQGVSPGDVIGFGGAGDGSDVHLAPRFVDGGEITIPMSHFSTGGASSGGAGAATLAARYHPTVAQHAAEQAIALAIATQPQPGRAIALALADWQRATIHPNLIVDFGRDLQALIPDFAEWLAWRRLIDLYGSFNDPVVGLSILDEFAGNQRTEIAQANDDAGAAADALLNRCTGFTDLVQPLHDVIQLQGVVDTLSLPIETALVPHIRRPLPTSDQLPPSCAHVEIDGVEHAAAFAVAKRNSISVHVVAHFWNGPDRRDIPVALQLSDVANGVLDSATVGDGQWQASVTPSSAGNVRYTVTANLQVGAQNGVDIGSAQPFNIDQRDEVELQARDVHSDFVDSIGSVKENTTVTLRVRLAGDGVAGEALTYSVSGVGQLSVATGVTDTTGEARFTFNSLREGTATITATRTSDGATDTLVVTVTRRVLVIVAPATVTLQAGETKEFTAIVLGALSNTDVAWGATGGTIDASGLFRAGSTPGTFAVTASSVEDPTATDTATVIVRVPGVALGAHEFSLQSSANARNPFSNFLDSVQTPLIDVPGTGPFSLSGSVPPVEKSHGDICATAAARTNGATMSASASVEPGGGLTISFSSTASASASITAASSCTFGSTLLNTQAASAVLPGLRVTFTVQRPMHYFWTASINEVAHFGFFGQLSQPTISLPGAPFSPKVAVSSGTLFPGEYHLAIAGDTLARADALQPSLGAPLPSDSADDRVSVDVTLILTP